ncbi:MAG: 30S ribosomal protein S8e [Candidatus Diapherotrites archaeon]|nr:30S ribosomal protein S8e [Candidatus Diapherotrites archaeon]
MAEYRLKSRRKPSGGIRHSRERCDKKLAWKGNPPTLTKVSERELRESVRTRGGNVKIKLKEASKAIISAGGKNFVADIKQVVENRANRQYARQNVITKGAIIEVEFEGKVAKAIVTSRPGQHGVVQAKLLEEKPL